MANKTRALAMSTRQKITAVLVVIVILIVGWQAIGIFKGSDASPGTANLSTASSAGPINNTQPPPQAVPTVPKPAALTPAQAELVRLQQETQAKYIAALNELQMLKIERDIAENQREIMKAKQDTVIAQKGIVELLAPPTVGGASYQQNLVTPTSTTSANENNGAAQQTLSAEVKYSVISVSQLQNKWSAVLGYQNNLYSVSIGDILPPDGSKVVAIGKAGVVLEKDGTRKTVSLVPVI
jgi:hypothetical protein